MGPFHSFIKVVPCGRSHGRMGAAHAHKACGYSCTSLASVALNDAIAAVALNNPHALVFRSLVKAAPLDEGLGPHSTRREEEVVRLRKLLTQQRMDKDGLEGYVRGNSEGRRVPDF